LPIVYWLLPFPRRQSRIPKSLFCNQAKLYLLAINWVCWHPERMCKLNKLWAEKAGCRSCTVTAQYKIQYIKQYQESSIPPIERDKILRFVEALGGKTASQAPFMKLKAAICGQLFRPRRLAEEKETEKLLRQ